LKNSLTKIAAAAALMLGAVSIASASADTSPKPGIYVAEGSECGSPANAAIRQYDGKGISTAHTHACKATVRKRKGSNYTVDQSCIDAGAGPAPRRVERQQVTVADALTFKQTIGKDATTYRYCPVYELPADLQKAAR
jgi:hypothetical protein